MDYQATTAQFASLGRSLLSIRRDQIHEEPQDQELESFQKHVTDLFADLFPLNSAAASSSPEDLLSLAWIHRLLDTFLICQEELRIIFSNARPHLAKPPVDRIIGDFFDRAVKALDLCNAVRDGIDLLRQWSSLVDVALSSLSSPRAVGEGQIRRAKKALTDLALLMIDDKDAAAGGVGVGSILTHRNRSFGRNASKDQARKGHFRSLSWSVSRYWSASKQLQAIGANLNAPRGNEVSQTNGLAVPVYTMNSVLLIVMWTLVAAFPCQDRGLQTTHFWVPRNFAWAASAMGIHEKILEESKKKERKGSAGLLKELHVLEKGARNLSELLDTVQVPITEDREAEVRQALDELAAVRNALKEGLDSLEKQVREVFYRIVRSRTEGLDNVARSGGE